jgi:glycosyltransferase involved in cell wall biosynthesis
LTARKAKRSVMVGIFIHAFRWGWQIRGDERGYIEKTKKYKEMGIDFYTLEKEPSLQDGMKERAYTSMRLGPCSVPPTTIPQLAFLSIRSLWASRLRYPSRPVAVYAYNQDVENLWVGYLLKRFVGAPLVVIYHHIRPSSFSAFGAGVADRLRRGFHPLTAITKSMIPSLNLYAAKHADVSIALSATTRDDVEMYLGIKDCVVIGNGLDTERFRPLDTPKVYDAVFLGRLAHQKGIDVLLNAWSEVVRGKPDSQLALMGGGDTKDITLYKKMAKDLRLSGNVTFTGFVDDEELVRILNSSKLFVFPSRKEGFAQAVSQAMGCGLCCLLSDIPSLKEVYGDAAVFVPVEQPSALARRITELLQAEDERKSFAKKALQLAEKLSWEDSVRSEIALITAHADGKSTPRK